MWEIAAGMAGANLAGGLLGSRSAKKAAAAQAAAARAALEELEKLGMPPDLSARVVMEQFQQQGLLNPEMEQEILLQSSEMAKIKEQDESLRGTQISALNKMKERMSGGMSAEERAEYNRQRQLGMKDVQAAQASILANAAARGQSGSGNELIAQLQAAQSGADRMSSESDRLQALASQNALQAISQGATMASNIRRQDYDVNADRLRAKDELDRFNTTNAISRQTRNVAARNEAAAQNLATGQRISEANIQRESLERQRMNEARRDFWKDKEGLAQAKANARLGVGSAQAAEHQNKAQMWAGLGQSISQGLGSYGQWRENQQAREDAAAQRQHENDLMKAYKTPVV